MYEYVVFESSDPYELPVEYFTSIRKIAQHYNVSHSNLSEKLRSNTIAQINDVYSVEKYRKEVE